MKTGKKILRKNTLCIKDNVILLDLDGVLITSKSWEPDFLLEDGFAAFSIKAVEKLNGFTELGYDIILTSARRYSTDIDKMNEYFKTRGVKGKIIGYIPLYDLDLKYSRYDEVIRFIIKHRPNRYLIIDDDKSLIKLGDSNWIKTDPMIGL